VAKVIVQEQKGIRIKQISIHKSKHYQMQKDKTKKAHDSTKVVASTREGSFLSCVENKSKQTKKKINQEG
jgi:hypothetical protein